jgi:lipopolysaccharide/colanic/teichoic acid biosynthesis glycosyltransferase
VLHCPRPSAVPPADATLIAETTTREALATDAERVDWESLQGETCVSRYLVARWVVDRCIAAVLLLLLLPLVLAIAVAVRLDSDGPVFFRQRRAGRHLEPFTIVKFRTMWVSAPHYSRKLDDDSPCVTRVGRLLRKSGLDEVPQLINVLQGQMALIGPRPEQLALLENYHSWQHARHLVRPGITGWWQIHHRSSEPMYLNVDKDVYYVRNAGPALDLRILGGTFKVLLSPLAGRRRRSHVRVFETTAPVAMPLQAGEEIVAELLE